MVGADVSADAQSAYVTGARGRVRRPDEFAKTRTNEFVEGLISSA
jgi:hypothetical protein